MITGAVDEAVALLRAGVDALLGVAVDGLDAAEFVPLLEAVEVQRRRLEAVDRRLLAGASDAGVASMGRPHGRRQATRMATPTLARPTDQTPRRNTIHHRPDIHLRQPNTAA